VKAIAVSNRPSLRVLFRAGLLVIIVTGVMVGPATVHSASLTLTWGSCGEPKIGNRAFACNTDAGADTLSVSFISDLGVSKVAQIQVFMSLCTDQLATPPWWQVLGAGACREGSLGMARTAAGSNCNSLWDPAAGLIQHIEPGGGGLHTSFGFRFVPIVTLADTALARDVVAGREYELFRLVIHHANTTGPGACAGCSLGASFAVDFIWLFGVSGIPGDNLGTSSHNSVTWQVPTTACSTITPAQRSTWGALKALYR